MADIAAIAERAKARGLVVVVDNTFASPYLQQPLALGADIVIHSATKYLGGHSDVVIGAMMLNDAALYERLEFLRRSTGAIPGPQDCWLLMRGIKTLPLRMERHCQNAFAVSPSFLSDHPAVKQVIYPGLPDHPQHELSQRQMRGLWRHGLDYFARWGRSRGRRSSSEPSSFIWQCRSAESSRSLKSPPG